MRKNSTGAFRGSIDRSDVSGAPTAAFAGETTTKEETAEKTGDKDSAEEKETAEDFQIGELTVKNQSGLEVKSAELQDAKEDDSKRKTPRMRQVRI